MTDPSNAPAKPSSRTRGMLGPDTPNEFGQFGDYVVPALRGEIDEFTYLDAAILLDDSMDAAQRKTLADLVRRAVETGRRLPSRPHGGHRWGTGWNKSEFPSGWGEDEVLDWIRALIDMPLRVMPIEGNENSFNILGEYGCVFGVVRVRPIVGVANTWYISTAHPLDSAVLLQL